jgi:TRAP-type mannitol/chloroaromatic compound transport system permease small subunit
MVRSEAFCTAFYAATLRGRYGGSRKAANRAMAQRASRQDSNMSALLAIGRAIDRLNSYVHAGAKWLVLAAIVLSAGNAVTRKFSFTSNAALELQWYLFSAVFLLCAGYTLLRGEHVRIDIVYARLSRRTQVFIDIFGTLFFLLPLCAVTTVLVWPVVLDKIHSGEVSSNAGGLILWPVWALMPTGFALLGLQGLSELIKRLAFLMGAAPDPALDQTSAH